MITQSRGPMEPHNWRRKNNPWGTWFRLRAAKFQVVAGNLLDHQVTEVNSPRKNGHLGRWGLWYYIPWKSHPFPKYIFLTLHSPNFQVFPNPEKAALIYTARYPDIKEGIRTASPLDYLKAIPNESPKVVYIILLISGRRRWRREWCFRSPLVRKAGYKRIKQRKKEKQPVK